MINQLEIKHIDLKNALNYLLICLFVVNAVFFPADNFGLKKIAFLFLMILNYDCFFCLNKKTDFILFYIGFFLTTYCILKSMLFNGNIKENITFGFAGYLVLLIIIIKKQKLRFLEITSMALTSMAILISISGILDVLGICSVYDNSILMWMYHNSNALVGRADYLPIGICIFLYSSPLLLLMIPICAKRHSWLGLAMCTIGVIFSGTRANVMLGLVVAFVSIYFFSTNRSVRYLVGLFAVGLFVLFFIGFDVPRLIIGMFEKKRISDNVRMLEFYSIIDVWKENPLLLLFGCGFSTPFYNYATLSQTVVVELSYLVLLRQVGLIPFCLMMYIFLSPALESIKTRRNLAIAFGYVAYLLVAATNPLLYSSTGFTALLIMMCVNNNYDIEYQNLAFDALITTGLVKG